MNQRWGDLRLLIDRRMKPTRSTVGPFFMDQVIELMLRIAEDMEGLHTKHDIIHRDLKASNVLVSGEFGANVLVVAPSEDEKIDSVVADFECSVGVLGTGIWRAPEILQQMRARVPSLDWEFTRASDVYSYGMTCYEIVSGHVPFEGWRASEAIEEVLDGVRPKLPIELLSYLRSIIESCWQSDPEMRPNFSKICQMLRYKQGCNPEILRISSGTNYTKIEVVREWITIHGYCIPEVENWPIVWHPTLLQVLETLLRMHLGDKEVKPSLWRSDTKLIVQHFESTFGECLRKIRDENIIAEIMKEVGLLVKIEWIVKRQNSTTLEWIVESPPAFPTFSSDFPVIKESI